MHWQTAVAADVVTMGTIAATAGTTIKHQANGQAPPLGCFVAGVHVTRRMKCAVGAFECA